MRAGILLLRGAGAAIVAAVLSASGHAADGDQELELIPPAAQASAQQAPQPEGGMRRNYIEDAFTAVPLRTNLLVTYPPPEPASVENRLFLDSRDEWSLGHDLTLTYSGRFNLRAANNLPFPSHENILNELREAFLSWQPAADTWIDIGRVNVKSGVAVGYNPTDFFRSRAVVEPLTTDPSILREDRLGTLMLLGQHVWPKASVTAVYAPRVTLPTAIYTSTDLPSFDPMLDRTNAENRLLLKGSVTVNDGFSPELLLYHAGGRTLAGANLTVGLGQQTIGYLEWSGGPQGTLIGNALSYGHETGTLPAGAPPVIPYDPSTRFRSELATGVSWTPADTRLTFNLEYHYSEAAFSSRDWQNWFAAAARHGSVAGVDEELWYIRSYAFDQQDPVSRHSAFLRADWVDAFVHDLEVTALANVNLQDGSGLVQTTADYYLSRTWTIGGQLSVTFGARHSEFGSLPQAGGILVRLVHYL